MRDVIVLLPGIMGSVLQKDGKDAWALSGGALIAALRSLVRLCHFVRFPRETSSDLN